MEETEKDKRRRRTEVYHLVIKDRTQDGVEDENIEVVYKGEAETYVHFLMDVVPDELLKNSDWEVRTAIFCTDKEEIVHDGLIEEVTD